ncbi:ATP-binding protein [Actinomycetospora cinnamomea]|uniref:Regulatory LuxR family protein n=1 Tax=Actinomycetospora cinnamomea TaxID=663609 RepID=A0A2U1FIH4_9PSEU|nr:AAA family ATPase [Actinomycetospora cinnamomea]PVZ11969.1 regulatory LuxR family protein [Actinomycetospora cinnamomea]
MATPRLPLIGREAERAAVRARVDALRAGTGGTLLLTGEAGIGKSRLLGEVADAVAGAGLPVLSGRAVAGGGAYRPITEALAPPLRTGPLPDTPRLRPFRAALARLVPGAAAGNVPSGPVPDPAVVLGEGVLALLTAVHGDRGVVLVLDDLHWADADTLDLLGYLAGAVVRAPVLLALAARDDEGDGTVGALTAHPDVTVRRLARLDADAVARLAARRDGPREPGVLRELVHRSEGLPFLVEELLAEGPATLPPNWTGLVARRLDALPDVGRAVVEAAAVAPGDPDHRLLAAATGTDASTVAAALRAGVTAGLLVAVDGRLTWRHALTRDAVLAALLPPERAALAGHVADALEARDRPGDREAAAARYADAGDPRRATALLLDLARRDADRGALGHADELLVRAAALGAEPGAVAAERVRVLTLRGEAAAALAVGDAALGSGAVTGAEHAELCLRLARTAVLGGRWAEAEERLARAARPHDPRSLVLAADAAFGAGDVTVAVPRARAAVRAAEDALVARHPDAAATLCEALLVLARCAMTDDDLDGPALATRAAQVAGEHGLAPWRVEALFVLGAQRLSAGDSRATDLAHVRDLAERHGMPGRAAQADMLRADAALDVDGPRAALAILLPAAEQLGRLRLTSLQGMAELFAAACTALAGDRAGAEALLAAAGTRADVPTEVALLGPLVPALTALLAHDLPRAAALADRAVPAALAHRSAAPVPYYGLWPLLRAAVGDRDAEARDLLRGHHVLLAVPNRGALTYADAVAAGRAGRGAEAAALADRAAHDLEHVPWWHRLLRTVVLDAAVRDGWGDPVPALRADLAVHERGDDAGARALARTCRDLLRAAGAPTRRPADPVPPDLRRLGVTAREAEVLALVTEHLGNADIAARLHLSTRTVESHVARLLAKTGTTDRARLRTWAQRAAVVP